MTINWKFQLGLGVHALVSALGRWAEGTVVRVNLGYKVSSRLTWATEICVWNKYLDEMHKSPQKGNELKHTYRAKKNMITSYGSFTKYV